MKLPKAARIRGSQMNKLKLALCLVTTFFAWAKGAEA
jgi:hypothetical protein